MPNTPHMLLGIRFTQDTQARPRYVYAEGVDVYLAVNERLFRAAPRLNWRETKPHTNKSQLLHAAADTPLEQTHTKLHACLF